MDSLKKYYGIFIFIAVSLLLALMIWLTVVPTAKSLINCKNDLETAANDKKNVQEQLARVQKRIKDLKNAIATSQKKIFSPIASDLGQDTLFFTLYNDIVEMVHANSVKIKSIDYSYNPKNDAFVDFGKDVYFVCDIDMDLVANYINLGKLIQDIYQYPYYIKINKLEVVPYEKDKKILLAKLGLRLYAHTSADDFAERTATPDETALDNIKSHQ